MRLRTTPFVDPHLLLGLHAGQGRQAGGPSALGVQSMRTIGAAPTKASTTVSSALGFPPSALAQLLLSRPTFLRVAGTSVAAISGKMFTFTPAWGIRTRQRLTGACGAWKETLFWPGILLIALAYSSASTICSAFLPLFSTSSL